MNSKTLPVVLSMTMVCGLTHLFAQGAAASTELARVNSQSLTLEEFNARYESAKKIFGPSLPSKIDLLEDWINREVALQAAKKEGVDKDPIVQDRIAAVIIEAMFEKKISAELQKNPPTETELKKYYQANPEIRTSHIFVPLPLGSGPEAEKKAREIIAAAQKELKSGKSFSEVVQKYSSGPGSKTGGDMDYQTKDRLDPEYYKAAVRLGSPGKISDVVRSQYGLHIIRLTAIRSWDDVDKNQIQRLFLIEKQNELRKAMIDALRKSSSIKVNKNLISN